MKISLVKGRFVQLGHAFDFDEARKHVFDFMAGMVILVLLTTIAMVDFWVFLVTASVIVAMPLIVNILEESN